MTKVLIYFIVYALAIFLAIYLFYKWISKIVNKAVRDQQTMDSLAEFATVIALEAAQVAANQAQERAIRQHMEAMAQAIDIVVHSYGWIPRDRWEDLEVIIATPTKPQRRKRKPVDWSKYGF